MKLEADFLKAYSIHAIRHGDGKWKNLRDEFPAMSEATFWRRLRSAQTFFELRELENAAKAVPEPATARPAPKVEMSARVKEAPDPIDPDDPSSLADHMLVMAENLKNSSIAVVDGVPHIANTQAYATAARLLAQAARLKLATWR